MRAIALLDIESSLGQIFVERFPEYYSQEEGVGPIPLSVLRITAEENAAKAGGYRVDDNLVTYGAAAAYNIPCDKFATGDKGKEKYGADKLPQELEVIRYTSVGSVITWNGRRIVILENNRDFEIIFFAPAETVDVNL